MSVYEIEKEFESILDISEIAKEEVYSVKLEIDAPRRHLSFLFFILSSDLLCA
jgi:hypothetical protein